MTRLTLSCAILLQAGLPSFAQADPLSEGRRMAEMFFRGETGAIWTASTPEMQQAFGSQDNLATIREDVSDAFGTEEKSSRNAWKTGLAMMFSPGFRVGQTPLPRWRW